MSAITLTAPAKINTLLKVMGRRPDGYHDVVMIMERLRLGDEVTIEPAERGIELTIDGTRDAGMDAEKNLAWRAAEAFRQATGERRGVHIHLVKRIPVAAGLGGGSSDAAATLLGLNQLWRCDWSRQQLARLGAGLGADVPFFCFEGPAIVEGIGDRVTPLPSFPKVYVLLINPGFAVSTAWVYGQWDCLYQERDRLGPRVKEKNGERDRKLRFTNHVLRWLTLERGGVTFPPLLETVHNVASNLVNDLEEVTIPKHPEVLEIKRYLLDAGAQGALMSGSGPTVFGLFEDEDSRDKAAASVRKDSWRVFATEN